MDNSLYIALARQDQLFRKLDVIANNVANVNTPGYKREAMMFTDYLSDAGRSPTGDGTKHDVAFSYDIATVRDLSEGAFKTTGRELDVAIDGPGYFGVGEGGNSFYTRVGSFTLNSIGQIVTSDGLVVQGAGGAAVTINPNDMNVVIDERGNVTVDVPGGTREIRGQLGIFTFANEQLLQKVDNTRFTAGNAGAATAAEVTDYRVVQGVLESSNVNSTQELTHMIKVTRSAESAARMVNDLHTLQRDMVSRVSSPAQ